ncbi:dioxygenase family protein [Mycolicibacterium confluentis]|uniref:Catechol 1,2-dioxygenase n=1 Tax=Mycolicibacterium confluentis TaxID=28047 RepID=A0A7I7Y4C3_9MYCO|nr:dioxygenase [Mycolicibacterium confluentis]MCV7319282.1 catechol 1,2-dioxygenase [Mycolicibacterium confluentis]ORV25778.1 catechol 1,2-dioxygenase [Mycolicibacterium confluentis]BBZ36506.1 catechol 1,2-dioxygenase [Mycolicibacterium confluentis]
MAFVTEDNITDLAVKRWATAHSPRTAELMSVLVRHIHDYSREVALTTEEWMAAVDWLTEVGKISTDKRQEFILASDVFGLSTLVVQMNNRFPAPATPATVLGPFYIDGSPPVPFGFDMSDGVDGTPLFITGTLTDTVGTPIAGATLDVWQADATGTYEAQYADLDEARLRAKYSTRSDGTYCVRTIAPIGYTIPMDGPVGRLISATDISAYRPAHVHCLFEAPGYHRLITHLFRYGTDYLDTDVVFGVKDELVVSFVEHPAGMGPDGRHVDEPFLVARYDFVLQALRTDRL